MSKPEAAREPKRLALFVPSLRGGGAERAMVTLANGFVRRGYDVDLVLAQAEGPYLSNLDSDIRVIDLKSSRVVFSLLRLVRYLRQERPYAMLSAMSHANAIAILARKLSFGQTKLVVSEHNSTTSPTWTEGSLRYRALRLLMSWAYPSADSIVVVSADMELAIAKKFPADRLKSITIHNPVITEELRQKSLQQPEHGWFEEGNPPVILAAGRLTTQKDFATLVHAMTYLHKQGRPERLVIVGEGPDFQMLKELIADLGLSSKIDLPGFVLNPYALMSRCSLFVLSSKWEGLPTVLIEAMACGARVVSTDCPTGPNEILEGGRWGTLVPAGDSDALARAMVSALDRTDAPDARERAAAFTEETAIERYLDVLDRAFPERTS